MKLGDKILLLLLCAVFVVGFGSAYFLIDAWQTNDTFERVLKFLGREVSLTILLFTVLIAIRCFISTPELEEQLASITLKMLVSMTLIGCALAVLLFLALLENFK